MFHIGQKRVSRRRAGNRAITDADGVLARDMMRQIERFSVWTRPCRRQSTRIEFLVGATCHLVAPFVVERSCRANSRRIRSGHRRNFDAAKGTRIRFLDIDRCLEEREAWRAFCVRSVEFHADLRDRRDLPDDPISMVSSGSS